MTEPVPSKEQRPHRGITSDWNYTCTDNDCWCWGSEHHNPRSRDDDYMAKLRESHPMPQLQREIEELRRDNRRWENAHKILLADIERKQQQITRLKEYICVTALAGYRCAPCAERLTAQPSKPAHEREMPHCSTCSCPPYEPPGIQEHLNMLAKGACELPAAMDASNAPTAETQLKAVSAINYHAREIARLTETWPVHQSYTAYDIDLFDAGRGVTARMRPEQNGRYYLRSDVDAARAAQPPGAEG